MSFGAALAADHPCARGQAIGGEFLEFRRGSTFRLINSSQDYVFAHVLIREVGGSVPSISGLLTLYASSDKPDRYGRIAVHVFQKSKWIQGTVLKRGQALAFGHVENPACMQALLDAENLHRARFPDFWRKKGQELNTGDLDSLSGKTGHFMLIRGKVRSVGDRQRRLYLNFGEKWAQDFTVSLLKNGFTAFGGSLKRLKDMSGRTAQVRGILEERQGPLIRVVDDIQIQIIE